MTDRVLLENASYVLLENADFILKESSTPVGLPDAPTIGTAVKGNASAQVPYTAPASDGGSTITSYTATSSPGSIIGSLSQAGSGTITVNGLTNGTAYTFTVHATNANGDSSESASSNSVTPSTVPGAPTGVSATAGDTTASVSFTAPASTGGAAITLYRATASTGQTATGASSPITVPGLTNGVAVTFTVAAQNLNGYGSESSASSSVTPNEITTVDILVRCPYVPTDTLGTKTVQVYDIQGGVLTAVGGAVTTGFSAIPNVTNGWTVKLALEPNGAYGDFAGIAVFSNINGSGKAAVELYSPPSEDPASLVQCKIAPFRESDTIGTPGYQLYDSSGSTVGSHVTAGILAISGVTNGYVTKLTLTPDANNGFQGSILWDG